ncbi:sulfotransferase family protein [Microbispora rosea]|uniref:sulfotransferase family protein n=1 Tax=Microbispora rosea TaxID=58117 RepID=UPI003D9001E9
MLDFLIGTGRCGSTLLYEVLARHPQVGFVSNWDDRSPRTPRFLRRNAGRIYRLTTVPLLERRRLRVRPCEGQRVLSREVSPAVVDPFRDLTDDDVTPWLAGRMRRFFGTRAAEQRTGHLVHKFTLWPRAAFLHKIFPGARFVHIVRDGRAVANSHLQMTWWRGHLGPSRWKLGPLPPWYREEWEKEGRSLVHLAGIGWQIQMDAFETARAAVPAEQWLEVRYEDLLADPRKHVGAVLDFLGLSWTPQFERGFARHTFRAGRLDAFRRDLTPDQLALLNRCLSAHLRRYGYAVGGECGPDEML